MGGGASLVSSSDVGLDFARRIRDERKRCPLRESQEKILDDALELVPPADRRPIAYPRLIKVSRCRLKILLKPIDLQRQSLKLSLHLVER